jgi:hypothetical protein
VSFTNGYTSTAVIMLSGGTQILKAFGGLASAGILGGRDSEVGGAVHSMGSNLSAVNLGTNFVPQQVVAHIDQVCVLSTDNRVKCFGRILNGYPATGISTSADGDNVAGDSAQDMGDNLPVAVLGSTITIKRLYAAIYHMCLVTTTDQIKCWGTNSRGQLGYGDTINRGTSISQLGDNLAFVQVGSGTLKKLAGGSDFQCALFVEGNIRCWGRNDAGQLGIGLTTFIGDGPNEMGANLASVSLGTGRTATDLSCGSAHCCALLDNMRVKCWGLVVCLFAMRVLPFTLSPLIPPSPLSFLFLLRAATMVMVVSATATRRTGAVPPLPLATIYPTWTSLLMLSSRFRHTRAPVASASVFLQARLMCTAGAMGPTLVKSRPWTSGMVQTRWGRR